MMFSSENTFSRQKKRWTIVYKNCKFWKLFVGIVKTFLFTNLKNPESQSRIRPTIPGFVPPTPLGWEQFVTLPMRHYSVIGVIHFRRYWKMLRSSEGKIHWEGLPWTLFTFKNLTSTEAFQLILAIILIYSYKSKIWNTWPWRRPYCHFSISRLLFWRKFYKSNLVF